ncbi:MAG: radical SAM protein [Oscillospiraceae bacterium]|nr:radical SAM protein [Oscillospiraceae bacterium]
MKNLELIAYAKQNALSGKNLDRASIIQLLGIPPDSPECEKLGKAARKVSSAITGDQAYLSGSIGVDFAPCSMSCEYCSMGKKWGIVQKTTQYTDEQVMEWANQYVAAGARRITLRTTEFYSPEVLGVLTAQIKKSVPGEYEVGLNMGEFDLETANRLYEYGVDYIYHTVRLGEGKNTRFTVEERLKTIQAVLDSPLQLHFCVEPIGVEHSDEEIADRIMMTIDYCATGAGCMARVPVKGTPLGALPQISERRMAQIAAVLRLAKCTGDISVHPPCELAVEWGCNSLTIEVGANPRDPEYCPDSEWKHFTAQRAKTWFQKHGYQFSNTLECRNKCVNP